MKRSISNPSEKLLLMCHKADSADQEASERESFHHVTLEEKAMESTAEQQGYSKISPIKDQIQCVLWLACEVRFSPLPTSWSRNSGFKSRTVANIKIGYFFWF